MKEDLELNPVDNHTITDAWYNYMSVTSYKGNEFWIIYDKPGFMDYLGFKDDSDFEDFLDDASDYNWGYSEDYDTCYNCDKPVYLNDFYHQDYWFDYDGNGLYCNDCIEEVPEIRDLYLNHLINNSSACNTILTDHELLQAGLEKLDGDYESGYFGRNDRPVDILNQLLDKFPNGKFIFNLTGGGGFSTTYEVWVYPGYDEGAENEEEQS